MLKHFLQTTIKNTPAAFYVALVYFFIFLPVAVLLLFSFQDSLLPIPPFQGPSLRWYQAVFADFRIMDSLGNSLAVGVVSATLSCFLAFLAAYGLARYPVRGSVAVQWLLVAPLSVSYLIIGMGLLITFKTFAIPKSLAAVIIGHIVINLPLAFAPVGIDDPSCGSGMLRADPRVPASSFTLLDLPCGSQTKQGAVRAFSPSCEASCPEPESSRKRCERPPRSTNSVRVSADFRLRASMLSARRPPMS